MNLFFRPQTKKLHSVKTNNIFFSRQFMRNEKENWSDPEANNKIIKHGPIKIIFNVFFSSFNFFLPSFFLFSFHFALRFDILESVFYWFCLSLLLLVVHYLFFFNSIVLLLHVHMDFMIRSFHFIPYTISIHSFHYDTIQLRNCNVLRILEAQPDGSGWNYWRLRRKNVSSKTTDDGCVECIFAGTYVRIINLLYGIPSDMTCHIHSFVLMTFHNSFVVYTWFS